MSTATIQTKQASLPAQPLVAKANVADSSMSRLIKVLRDALPAELNAHGAQLSPEDMNAVAQALARQVVGLVVYPGTPKRRKAQTPSQGEWITTQEAANRCGFSRPFVATLLDSGAYKGQVKRTPGGHRKVLASEFETQMTQASAKAPKTLAQARKAVDLTRLDEGKAVPGTARKQSRDRARVLAKQFGLIA